MLDVIFSSLPLSNSGHQIERPQRLHFSSQALKRIVQSGGISCGPINKSTFSFHLGYFDHRFGPIRVVVGLDDQAHLLPGY